MLDGTKANRIPEPRSGSIKPGTKRPKVIEHFRSEVDRIADDFQAQLRTQNTGTVLEYFVAARALIRRRPRTLAGVYKITGECRARYCVRGSYA